MSSDSNLERVGKRKRQRTEEISRTDHTYGPELLRFTDPLPPLIVLDLDKTLWPFYCHEQTAGPYKRGKNGDDSVRCSLRYGGSQVVSLFPFVGKLLRLLSKQGSIQLAIASRSPDETAARGILDTLGLLDLFCCLQIYSGSKATHFKAIQTCTGLPFRKMLFFDDERANIEAVAKLGVCCLHVGKEIGLTPGAVQAGFKKYREACLSRSSLQKWLQPREDVCPKSVTSKRGVMNQHVFDV